MPLTSKDLLKESQMRRTYRKFLPEKVDMEVIKDCILTAGTAPNGANKQPWHFSIITNEELKKKIREKAEEIEKDFYKNKISKEWKADLEKLTLSYEKPFLTEAPCLIGIFKENYVKLPDGTIDKNYYPNESIGIAIGFLINALRNAGYASLTYTLSPMLFLKEILNRPEGEQPVMILVVGKPDITYELPKITKKSFEEIADIID